MKTLYTNGDIWCSRQKYTTAVLTEDGVITALGDEALASDYDEKIDLSGKFMAPGFIDAHAHPLFAGRESQGPKLNGLASKDEIITEVDRYIKAHPEKSWIIGGAYEASIVAGGDFEAGWLDEVSSDVAVVLHAADHHTIWVNSKALHIAGITAETENPAGGSIARYDDGTPKGTLREPSAINLILKHAPVRTIEDDVAAIEWACEQLRSAGVTSATDAWVEPGMPEAYIAAAKSGALTVNTNLFFLAQPDSWREQSDGFAKFRSEIVSLGASSKLQAKTVKFICDGALSAGTAALLQPYLDAPESKGLLVWSNEELLAAMAHFDSMGFQIHAHAIGDAAIRQALDAIEAMQEMNPSWDRRPVIAHAQLIDEDDLHRFTKLGVIANIQPLWTYLDSMNAQLIEPRIGSERNNRQYQLKSLQQSGARIAYGSDWPVTSHDPMKALAVPTHRTAPGSSKAWSLHESISIEDSLCHYTEDAAYSNFWNKGVIAVGADADFLFLSENPLKLEAADVSRCYVIQSLRH